MIEVTRRTYTARQIERWHGHVPAYVHHTTIGEDPARTVTSRHQGMAWLPGGLPDGAGLIGVAANVPGQFVVGPIEADGEVTFGTGVATFAWVDLAVLAADGGDLWETTFDLGVKGPLDVWTVRVAADPTDG